MLLGGSICAIKMWGKELLILIKNKLLKGYRHIVQTEKEDFLLRKEFQNGLRQLGKFKLTYDLLILPNQINAAIKLVSLFPDQVFILDHLAKPKIFKTFRIELGKSH